MGQREIPRSLLELGGDEACFPSKPIQAGALLEPGFTTAMKHFDSGLESQDASCMSGYFILIGIG